MKTRVASSKSLSLPLLLAAWGALSGAAVAQPPPELARLDTVSSIQAEQKETSLALQHLATQELEYSKNLSEDLATQFPSRAADDVATSLLGLAIPLSDLEAVNTSAQSLFPTQAGPLAHRPATAIEPHSVRSLHPSTLAPNLIPTLTPEVGSRTTFSESAIPIALEPVVNTNDDPMAQVNNVFELRDVEPGDWAYEALQNLVSRYGCVEGYPNGTFRGDRALSRYEFAAALNACLQLVERILLETSGQIPPSDDLEALQRLTEEFEAELATLPARIDDLEGRVDYLENNQFSTTTKLFGQVIIGVQGQNSPDFQLAGNTLDDNNGQVFSNHTAQLSLFTQFSPRSLLFTSFVAGDGRISEAFADGAVNFTRLAYLSDTANQLQLSDLNYRHLIGRNFAVMVGPEGISPVNVFRGSNRIESSGSGPLSSFAQRNPILSIGGGSGGVGVDWQISSDWSVQGVYAAQTPEDPVNGGLFGSDGTNSATTFGMQLVYSPTLDLDFTFQYINNYSPIGRLLTGIGDSQLIIGNTAQSFNLRAPMKTNALGLGTEWRLDPKVNVGGWLGYTISDYLPGSGQVQTFNWMAFLSFPDLGGEGNLGALYFGQPPRITHSNVPDNIQVRNIPSFFTNADLQSNEPGGQPGTSFHIEGFYRIRLTDNINITPGVIVVLDPLHNPNNDTVVIGALRTTFTF
ncbi:MAG: iron uptake porin [Cyanobacteria bacterium P01_G01_bin.54]